MFERPRSNGPCSVTPGARMKPARMHGSRDANHESIAKWYLDLMCLVADTDAAPFFVDLVVRIPTVAGAILQMVEIKTEKGREKSSQKTLQAVWGGLCVRTVRTQGDVQQHVLDVQGRFIRALNHRESPWKTMPDR